MDRLQCQAKTAPVYQVGAVSHISSFGETMKHLHSMEKFQHVVSIHTTYIITYLHALVNSIEKQPVC